MLHGVALLGRLLILIVNPTVRFATLGYVVQPLRGITQQTRSPSNTRAEHYWDRSNNQLGQSQFHGEGAVGSVNVAGAAKIGAVSVNGDAQEMAESLREFEFRLAERLITIDIGLDRRPKVRMVVRFTVRPTRLPPGLGSNHLRRPKRAVGYRSRDRPGSHKTGTWNW